MKEKPDTEVLKAITYLLELGRTSDYSLEDEQQSILDTLLLNTYYAVKEHDERKEEETRLFCEKLGINKTSIVIEEKHVGENH